MLQPVRRNNSNITTFFLCFNFHVCCYLCTSRHCAAHSFCGGCILLRPLAKLALVIQWALITLDTLVDCA